MGKFSEWLDKREMEKFAKNYNRFLNMQNYTLESPLITNEEYNILENKAWYEATSATQLLRFYDMAGAYVRLDTYEVLRNNFYKVSKGSDLVYSHANLAKSIIGTMNKLIFPNLEITLEDKELEERLNKIFRGNKFDSYLLDWCSLDCSSGCSGIEFILDKDFSDDVIFKKPFQKSNILINYKYGQISEVIYTTPREYNKESYTLYTIYGKGFIDYKLYKEKKVIGYIGKSDRLEVPLETIPDYANLKKHYFINSNGEVVKKIFTVYKENKTGALSDYSDIIDDLINLDEAYTSMMTYIRDSGVEIYVPDNMTIKDPVTGAINTKNSFGRRIVRVSDASPNWENKELKRDFIEINNNINGYKEAMDKISISAITGAGLSPSTMGFDFSGANSSALALEIRESASLVTQKEKQSRWDEALKQFVILALQFEDLQESDSGDYIINDELDDLDISINFGEYKPELSKNTEIINGEVTKLNANLSTLQMSWKKIYPYMSDEEIETNISISQGLIPEDIESEDMTKDVVSEESEEVNKEEESEEDSKEQL